MKVTIKDIAKLANVSPSTVSRVVSDHPGISEETKKRVRAIMEEKGYHPNYQAKSLSSQSTQMIGIVMPDSTDRAFQNPFFLEIIRGITNIAKDKSYDVLIVTGSSEKETLERVKGMVMGKRIDGFILLYSKPNDRVTTYLQDKDFPFVIVGKPTQDPDQISHVDNDNVKAAKDAVHYLVKQGHKKIGFIGGDSTHVVNQDRFIGYCQALDEAGLSLDKTYVLPDKSLEQGGQEAAEEIVRLKDKPTALLVTDDLIAFGMLPKFSQYQLTIPNDMSIISFNNVMIAELSHPALTSVDIQVFKLGYYAGDCLIERITNPEEPHKRIIVPTQLVVREST